MSDSLVSFRFPTGIDCPLDRAIAFNSSLTWRQALPRQPHYWAGLRLEQVDGIARLARALRDLERKLDAPKRWGPACWEVVQWWEPAIADWSSGRRALITPRRHTPQEALRLLESSPLRHVWRRSAIEVLVPRRLSRPPAA